MRELNKFISRVRLKIRSVLFFNWLLELYIYLSAIYIVNYFFHLDVSYYYLLIPVFFAIFLSLVRPIDNRDVAIIIDKDLGLDERVITSLEFNGLDSPIVKRLISETVDMLRNLNIKNVYPFRFRKRLKYLLLIPLYYFSLYLSIRMYSIPERYHLRWKNLESAESVWTLSHYSRNWFPRDLTLPKD